MAQFTDVGHLAAGDQAVPAAGHCPVTTNIPQYQWILLGRHCLSLAWGFHPLASFADHGPDGSGEPLAIMLRPGNAGSKTAGDHIEATRLALAQLPAPLRRRVLIRADCGGGTHEFLAWLASPGRRLAYSVGMTITDDIAEAILPPPAATPRRHLAPGPSGRHRDHPPPGPHARLTTPDRPCDQERKQPGPWNPARLARQPGRQADRQPGNRPRRRRQATQPRSRKIQASQFMVISDVPFG